MNQRITSNIRYLAFAAAAGIAATVMTGTARAEGPIQDIRPATGALTRAQVQAELMKHRGQLTSYASEWTQQQAEPMLSATTREQVRAAYIASRDEVRAMNAEDSGATYLARMPMRTAVMVARDRAAE